MSPKKKATKKTLAKKSGGATKKAAKKKAPVGKAKAKSAPKSKATAKKASAKKKTAKAVVKKKAAPKKATKKTAPKKAVKKTVAASSKAKPTKAASKKKTAVKKATPKKAVAKKVAAKKAVKKTPVKTSKAKVSKASKKKPQKTISRALKSENVAVDLLDEDRPVKKVVVKFKPEAIEKFRNALLTLRARLYGDVNMLSQEALGDEESSRAPLHPAEVGTHSFEQEFTLKLMSSEGDRLSQIEAALEKISDGSYGACDECGGRIPKARLEAIPEAPYCVKCASKLEG